MMAEHYFTAHPSSPSKRKYFEATLCNKAFSFYADQGVFSKNEVDEATRLLVETVAVQKQHTVLDMGCGYGVIGIALASQVACITMCDINERALGLARDNVVLNRIVNATILKSDQYASLHGQTFDIVVMNPPIRAGKKILYDLLAGARNHLTHHGSLWIVMHKQHGALSAIDFLEKTYARVFVAIRRKGMYVIQATGCPHV